jgi:HAD superfamily hydrolase (TIGR01549 family)
MLKKVNALLKAKNAKQQEFTMFKTKTFSIVEDMEFEAAEKTEMFTGVPETLKKLKTMNLQLGLCTISGEKVTRYILERFNLEHFFDAVITRDSVREIKPHPEQLQAALNALQVKPHEAVLVGDSIKDVACALQLNVIAVGVTTGLSSIEKLTNAGAHYIASTVTDIPRLIQQLKKQF